MESLGIVCILKSGMQGTGKSRLSSQPLKHYSVKAICRLWTGHSRAAMHRVALLFAESISYCTSQKEACAVMAAGVEEMETI